LIGAFFVSTNGQNVQADQIDSNQTSAVIEQDTTATSSALNKQSGTENAEDKASATDPEVTGKNTQILEDKSEILAENSATPQESKQSDEAASTEDTTAAEGTKATTDLTVNKLGGSNIGLLEQKSKESGSSNGGYSDTDKWGTLDVSHWHVRTDGNYLTITGYDGDRQNENHIIIPNGSDFAKAGKNDNNLQAQIDADTTNRIMQDYNPKSLAFSKTNDKKVLAKGDDWQNAFTAAYNRDGSTTSTKSNLSDFDGNNLDTSGISNINGIFDSDQLTDLSGVRDWNTDNLTDIDAAFYENQLTDLSGLENWNVQNVTQMYYTFANNKLTDLSALSNWKPTKATELIHTFENNNLTNLHGLENWPSKQLKEVKFTFSNNNLNDISALAGWDVSHVTSMNNLFSSNDLEDLSPIKDWSVEQVTDFSSTFSANELSDLTPLKNWNTGSATTFYNTFFHNKLTNLKGLENWNTSKVTKLEQTFAQNQINDVSALAKWDTSNVTDMPNIFDQNKLTNLTGLENWDVSKVETFGWAFRRNQLNDISALRNWKTTSATSFEAAFVSNKINDVSPLAKWDMSNVLTIESMLADNEITDLTPLKDWKTSSLKKMMRTFDQDRLKDGNIIGQGPNITKADFSTWDFSHLSSKADRWENQDGSLYDVTGLYQFMNEDGRYIIYLGDNQTVPTWANSRDESIRNENPFATNTGNHLIVTNNSNLLSNPNGAYNHLTFKQEGKADESVETPVFMKAESKDKILAAVQAIDDQKVAIKQREVGNKYKITLDPSIDQTDPISLINAIYNIVPADEASAQIQFKDVDPRKTDESQAALDPLTFSLSGETGHPINLNRDQILAKVPENYELADDSLPTGTFGTDKFLTINLKHKHNKDTYDKAVTRTINYVDEQGNVLHEPTVQQLTFTVTTVTDAVTGEIISSDYGAPQTFASVKNPQIPGYHTATDQVDALTVDGSHGDVAVQVIYIKDGSGNPGTPDTPNTPDTPDTPKTPDDNKDPQEETKNPITKEGELSQKVDKTTVSKKTNTPLKRAVSKQALPQTGAKKSSAWAIGLGLIGLALAAGFMTLNRKRK
jgi:LPXTG-motif cell wall-anchored protein